MRLLPKQVKLFADGAIISQLMQMREPYLDDDGAPDPCHHGEWMMQPDTFRAFARAYWNADWQLHVHVNGDAGLDLVLDTVEECQAEHPRTDHRTVIVHFANSSEEQVDRIARLGCIVSANSYYPVGFADAYPSTGWEPAAPTPWSGPHRCWHAAFRCRCTPTCRWARPPRWPWPRSRSTAARPAAGWPAQTNESRCTTRYAR